jgi:hypothetical protein
MLSTPEWRPPAVHHAAGSVAIARILTFGLTMHWWRPAMIGRDEARILQVSISSIAPSAPIPAPQASAPKTTDPTVDADASDAGAAQPTPPPPLPPGQGTRVDQLV